MPKSKTRPRAVFLSDSWCKPETELSFVTRSLAGAASRAGDVAVLVPLPAGERTPDGAFDLVGIGQSSDGQWPQSEDIAWPDDLSEGASVVIDRTGGPSDRRVEPVNAGSVHTISSQHPDEPGLLRFTPASTGDEAFIGVQVPINPLAATHHHNGLGFTDYLLVLTDREGIPDSDPPTAAVAWLTAAFHDSYVVVVEGAQAAVWKGRALRGRVGVETRTDLWRLLAHAHVTIDLAPGKIVARECIESLRFGTPIFVPDSSVAVAHAHAGGGATFTDILELVRRLGDLTESARQNMAQHGRAYADTYYGDTPRFVDDVMKALFA